MRANVYVDGFNLYYGALKGTRHRWLDLARLCQLLLPKFTINRIRYFTALVQPRPGQSHGLQNQLTYIRALQTIPHLTVHYGSFIVSRVRMPLASPPTIGSRTVEVVKTEEKGSDVNLATLLLCDGFAKDYDVAIVVSNDSDLAMPIEVVRSQLGLQVGLLNPHPRPSRELLKVAGFIKQIRTGVLKAS